MNQNEMNAYIIAQEACFQIQAFHLLENKISKRKKKLTTRVSNVTFRFSKLETEKNEWKN